MDSAKEKVQDIKNTFFSGGPGTTGREVFEDSTASGPGAAYGGRGTGTATGAGAGTGAGAQDYSETQSYDNTGGVLGARPRGEEHHHHHHHGHHGEGAGVGGQGQGQGQGQAESGLGSAGVRDYSDTQSYNNTGGVLGAHPATTNSGQYGQVSPVSGGTLGGDGTHRLQHPVHHNPGHGGEAAAVGAGAGFAGIAAAEGEKHYHHHGHHGQHGSNQAPVGATGTTGGTQEDLAQGGTGADAAAPGAAGGGVGGPTASTDKTGTLGQDSHLYERTGTQGPLTSGAAGTDRFDTDKPSAAVSNVTGATTAGGQRVPEGEAGSAPKGTGGIMGVLGTSDKDFTERERKGTGAYADTHGHFQLNTSGPQGNTALTGREGNPETNPVAQAQSRGDATSGSNVTRQESIGSDGQPKKKGFMEKVKEALS